MSTSSRSNVGSRSSRLSSLSNGQLHEQYKNRYRPSQSNGHSNGHANGHSNGIQAKGGAEGEASLSFLGPRLHKLAADLEERLETQSEKPGWAGTLARSLLERGMWLEERIESEVDLRTHAIGAYTFKNGVTRKGVEGMLEKQLRLFPKYKEVLRNTGRRWHGSTFVDDPNWDMSRHIYEAELPEPAGRKELDDFTAEFVARPWDFEKPLWENTILHNFVDEESGAKGAMVIRGHHTLTDGQGFVMSQLLVSSYGPELEKMLKDGKATLRGARRGTAQPSKLHKGLRPLDPYRNMLLLQIVMFALFWSVSLLSSTLDLLGAGYQGLCFALNFLFFSWRQQYVTSEYEGPRVAEKEFSTSLAFPMSDVKKIQKAFSGPKPGGWIEKAIGRSRASQLSHLTLNDVLCTIIADAIADEIDSQPDERLPGLLPFIKQYANRIFPTSITLMIPISIRPVGNVEMSNWSSGTIANLRHPNAKHGLPIGARPMHARLHENANILKVLKSSILPKISFWLIQITGQAPLLFPSPLWTPFRPIVERTLAFTLESLCAVVTNIPGPSGEGITMADSEVARWTAAPPQGGKSTLGIGIISYAEKICITIAADHVKGRYSEGVARRLTSKFEERWQQYCQVADEILARAESAKRRKR